MSLTAQKERERIQQQKSGARHYHAETCNRIEKFFALLSFTTSQMAQLLLSGK